MMKTERFLRMARARTKTPRTAQRIGAYRLVRLLGEGGMGQVFEAIQDRLEKRVAIKVLKPEMASDVEMLKRFFTEAKAVSAVKHPGLIDVYEFGELDDGSAFMVMEFLEGESLHQRLSHYPAGLPIPMVIRLVRQVAAALSVTHQAKIVHRDLKPDNIMLVKDSEVAGGERCKILDFGIAKLANRADVKTRTGTVMGTPAYMSPEQCGGPGEISDRTDVYSLGIIAYELLTGSPPFVAEEAMQFIGKHMFATPPPLQEKRPDVPVQLAELVHRMLAKEPAVRPTANQLAGVLAKLGSTASAQEELQPPWDDDATRVYTKGEGPELRGPSSTLRRATGQSQRILGLRRRHVGLIAGALVLTGLFGLALRRPPASAKMVTPEKPVPVSVKWSVRSVPSGAKVVDALTQEPIAETPWTAAAGESGAARKLILKLDGYQDAEITLQGGQEESVEQALQALPMPPRAAKPQHKAGNAKNKLPAYQLREKNAKLPLFKL